MLFCSSYKGFYTLTEFKRMIELNPFRKNKINLADYDYEEDIAKRVILSNLNELEIEVLEDILFNSTRFPISDISRNLEIRMDELLPIIEKLEKTKLYKIDGDALQIDKEQRRYYELHLQRFEEDFEPGMEFLQQLLKNVPIHILPNWYHIPRTSDNIFHSLVEKYLLTPQVFQRYLMELNLGDEALNAIVNELFSTSKLRLPCNYLKAKYSLTDHVLQEYILHLEYNLVCSVKYEKNDGNWECFLTPFKEWKEYLQFINQTTPESLSKEEVSLFREDEYAFSEDMKRLLQVARVKPISVQYNKEQDRWIIDQEHLRLIADGLGNFNISYEKALLQDYLVSLLDKLLCLKLVAVKDNYLHLSSEANEWINLPSEKRALHTYKHPLNALHCDVDSSLMTDKNIREIEKSITRIIGLGWVSLDDFLKGVIAPLNDRTRTQLKKTGRYWKYTIPEYSQEEFKFIKHTILTWLFESGIIQTGLSHSETCIRVTNLGKILFGE